jgi:hypothetical protein
MSNTFVIKEVLDYNVSKYAASGYGDFLFSVDYAKSSTVQTTATRLPIRGGQGNYKIIDLDHTKDCMFNSVLPLVDIKALAVKLGRDIATGATSAPKKDIKVASGTNTITLSHTPLAGTLKVYKLVGERDLGVEQLLGTPASVEDKYSIATATLTFNVVSVPENTKIIAFYDYTSGATAQNAKITAADFPEFITITGRGLVDDDVTGSKVPVTFKVHKAKVKPEFELTMASDAATELPFDCDCYTILNANAEREFVDIVKLNDEAS